MHLICENITRICEEYVITCAQAEG
jgi:hypothetical protein